MWNNVGMTRRPSWHSYGVRRRPPVVHAFAQRILVMDLRSRRIGTNFIDKDSLPRAKVSASHLAGWVHHVKNYDH
jgi:hypothetical protein